MPNEVKVESVHILDPQAIAAIFAGGFGKEIQEKMCEQCNGACCRSRYMFSEKATPQKLKEKEMWEMSGIIVVENGEYLEYYAQPCKNLNQETGKCNIYPDRPQICKDFMPGCYECMLSRNKYYKR